MEKLIRKAERAKPIVEVFAYGMGALWVAFQLVVRDCNGEFLLAGDVQITNVRRTAASGAQQRIVFDATFTTKRVAWRVKSAGATVLRIAGTGPPPQEPDPADDGCHGSLSQLTKFSRLESDTPYRVSCVSPPVERDACYRVGVQFDGQRSLLVVGTLFSGAPTVASAEATSCPDDAKGDLDDRTL